MKPRVFVSSVIEGFEEMRQAARRGIEKAGCEPVLVNEDFPALADSPRNACLDAVERADIFVIVVGTRGGFKAPSGKLVTEEEFEHAGKHRLPVLAFIQDGQRDEEATRFVGKLSDFVDGLFRTSFENVNELESAVEPAVRRVSETIRLARLDGDSLLADLRAISPRRDEAWVRIVIALERDEELLDPGRIQSNELIEQLQELAHLRRVRLFRYEAPKQPRLTETGLCISQVSPVGYPRGGPEASLEVRQDGKLLIDYELGGAEDNNPFSGLTIVSSDLRDAARRAFLFADAFYAWIDPWLRQTSLWYGTSLANTKNRSFFDEVPKGSSLSGIGAGQRDPLVGESPRLISRSELKEPDREIERIIAVYRQRLRPRYSDS